MYHLHVALFTYLVKLKFVFNRLEALTTSLSFWRYISTGLIANGIGLSAYYTLLVLSFAPEIAAIISSIPALLTGYLLNRYWSFRSNVGHGRGITTYLLSMAVMLLFQITLLSLLHRIAGLPPFVAQLIALAISVPVSYVLQKKWVFVS